MARRCIASCSRLGDFSSTQSSLMRLLRDLGSPGSGLGGDGSLWFYKTGSGCALSVIALASPGMMRGPAKPPISCVCNLAFLVVMN